MGGELKNAVCLTRGDQAFLGPHVGDLSNEATQRSLAETTAHLARLLEISPALVAHDLHPDYLSTRFAEEFPAARRIAVQHHHAHMAACMAEHRLDGEAIGVVFDGTGYGEDGTVWGGEFLLGSYGGFRRRGHFRTVRLPGGDAAAREPWRMAIAYLHDARGEATFDLPLPCVARLAPEHRRLFASMLSKGVNSPLTSSCGRLFDAVAALVGLRMVSTYEGQAAIELEGIAEEAAATDPFPFTLASEADAWIVDFRPTTEAIVAAVESGEARGVIARRFHETVAAASVEVCARVREESGVDRVVLSGGAFQNKLLTGGLHARLTERGFRVFTHRLVPPNDGGLALGQAAVAGRITHRGAS